MGLFKEQMYRLSEISKTQKDISSDHGLVCMGIQIKDFTDPLLSELKDIIDSFPDDMKERTEHRTNGTDVMVTWKITITWDDDNIQMISISFVRYQEDQYIQLKSERV